MTVVEQTGTGRPPLWRDVRVLRVLAQTLAVGVVLSILYVLWFNLTNEPHDINTEQWVHAANAAIAAIRRTGAGNVVLVPGNGWTGAHSWYHTYYGTPNAKAMLAIDDPWNNVVFEAHQYLDSNSSGGSSTCVSPTIGRERLTPFVRWLRENRKKGFIGEFAGGANATCSL